MRAAVDTNVLVYAEGHGDERRCRLAADLMRQLSTRELVLPVQVLGETFRVLSRKYRQPPEATRVIIDRWSDLHSVADSTAAALQAGLDAATEHQLDIWDALILAVAAEHRCAMLLSEDMQHGFVWRGVCVVNPFTTPMHPRLAALLV